MLHRGSRDPFMLSENNTFVWTEEMTEKQVIKEN